MPVRSSTSSVLKWPESAAVLAAVRAWAAAERSARPETVRLGLFGSYARGDAGVGSDLDLVVVVSETAEPFERRAAQWDLTALPVPAELLVYTEQEWDAVLAHDTRFSRMLEQETIWLADNDPQ